MKTPIKLRDEKPNYDPSTMLPAWFLTDSNLKIINWNCIFAELIYKYKIKYELFSPANGTALLTKMSKAYPESESFWEKILVEDSIIKLKNGLTMLEEIIKLTKELNTDSKTELFDKLNEIKKMEDSTMYIHLPSDDVCGAKNHPKILAGIKIAPPEGLRLKEKVVIARNEIGFIDVVLAVNFNKSLQIDGVQVGLYDCTDRHVFWENSNQISRLLVHSFKNPLGTAQRLVAELSQQVSPKGEQVLQELRVSIEQSLKLSKLTNFTNHGAARKVRICDPAPDIICIKITLEDIKKIFAQTVWNIYCGDEEIICRETAKQLLAEDYIDNKDPSHSSFELLAEKVVKGLDCFYITLDEVEDDLSPEEPESSRKALMDFLEKTKDRILHMMIDEMVLNAVRQADHKSPCVSVKVLKDPEGKSIEIQVCNNGNLVPESWHENFEEELLKLSLGTGNKRKPLGLRLNFEAAKLLGIKFTPQKAEVIEDNLFVLTIPTL